MGSEVRRLGIRMHRHKDSQPPLLTDLLSSHGTQARSLHEHKLGLDVLMFQTFFRVLCFRVLGFNPQSSGASSYGAYLILVNWGIYRQSIARPF